MTARQRLLLQLAVLAGIAVAAFLGVGVYMAGLHEHPMPAANQPMFLENGCVRNHRITTAWWSVCYDRAEVAPNESDVTIDGVHDGVFYRRGKPYMTLSAQHLAFNRSTLDFTATGRVHVGRVGAGGESFDTDLVQWLNGAKLIRLDHPSYFHTGGQTLRADHVTVDLSSGDVHVGSMNGNVYVQ